MMSQSFRHSLLRISFSAVISLSAGMLCAQVPSITSFSPTSGPVGTVVTITGTNFDPWAPNNMVWFGAVKKEADRVTPTELIVRVPSGTTYEPITVTTLNGLTAYSARPFNVTFQSSRIIDSESFAPRIDFNAGTYPHAAALCDLDGNGKTDLIIINRFSNTISVFRNLSTSGDISPTSFAWGIEFTTGSQPLGLAVGDIDGDFRMDIAVANHSSNSISVFRNISTPGSITSASFEAKVDLSTGDLPYDVAIRDIDGDGKPDLLVTNSANNSVSIFRNISTPGSITAGSFAEKVDLTTGMTPYDIAAGDLDGDGKADIVVTNLSGSSITLFRNISTAGSITSGSFETGVDFMTASNPLDLSISDIDGDGKPDLIVSYMINSGVSFFRNISSPGPFTAGSFDPIFNLDHSASGPFQVTSGDIDGDGKPDLAVSNHDHNTISVYRNTGSPGSINSGSFGSKTDFSAGTGPKGVELGDLNGDGKPDLVVVNSGNNNVSVLQNKIPESLPPSITSFTPASGPVGTEVIITGSDFSEQAVDNTVTFGTVEAIVTAATANQLTVTVPQGAVSDFISVTVNGLTATSGTSFIVTLRPPVILSFTPASGPAGTTVTITGSNFSSNVSGNIVRFGTVQASVISATETQLIVTVPGGATTQPIYVEVNGMTAFTSTSFVVLQPPVVYSFYPESGPVGTTVTMTGSNFDPAQENNIVWFGAVQAMVTSATANQLTVIVPIGTTYQPITVTVSGLTAWSEKSFNVTYQGSQTIDASSFAAKVNFTTGSEPHGITIVDIDNDGKPDLVVTNWNDGFISVYRNISTTGSITTGSFADKVDFPAGGDSPVVKSGDIDGDGKQDLIVVGRTGNMVSIFRNTSTPGTITTGSFAARVDLLTGDSPTDVTIGDIDGDGKPDIAVTNSNSSTVSVFRNECTQGIIATNSFSARTDLATGTNPKCVAIGDIDGDRKPDLVVTNYQNSSISIFRNISTPGSISSGSFESRFDLAAGNGPCGIEFADIDSDGKPDLVVVHSNDATVSVYRNTSVTGSINTTSFAPKVDFATNAAPYDVAVSDINGDGKPDLVVQNNYSNPDHNANNTTLSVFKNTSSSGTITTGSFAARVDYKGGGSFNVDVCDLDGDNKPDIVVTDIFSNTVSVLRNTITDPVPPVITSFNPTSGPVGTTVTITGSNFSTTAANNIVWFGAVRATVTSATANQLTVLVPIGTTYQPISVTVNGLTAWYDKSFNVTFPGSQIIDSSSFAQKVDFTTGMYPSATSGDIDCDGKPDIIVTNAQDNQISVLRNISFSGFISPASFAEKVDFTTGTNPFFTDLGDLDGDGRQDLAVYNLNGISVFRNTSTTGSINAGSFADKIDFGAGGSPRCIAIRDIDGDGRPDMAVTNYESNTVSIFRNTSSPGSLTTASFAAQVDITTGINPNFVVIADIDGDGKPDLLVSNRNSYSISVFRNISTQGIIETGSFSEKVDFLTGGDPVCIAVGDLDGDGKADMIVLNNYNGTVSIFRNTSTPGSISESSFADKVDFTSESMPEYVSIGDINGDGKPDLAVSNAPRNIDFSWVGGNTISVFRNKSTPGSITSGSFAPRVDFATGYFPFRVSIGDIDGDYKPDLVVANGYTNSFSILRNTITEPVPPVINSLTPTNGPVGAPVTITGSNFSTTPEDNIVMFGDVQATVTGASQNQLTVLVPSGADGQSISVTVYGQTAYFDVTFALTDPMEIELESAILTLNGDGINERFIVKNFQAYGASKFYVFNARGALVYWDTDFQGEWDVTLHNQRFETGGYFYVIETSIGTFRGSFSILRD